MIKDIKQIAILAIASVAGFFGTLIGIHQTDYVVSGFSALLLGFCGKLLFDKYQN